MEKPYFYHKFKVSMSVKAGFYENFVSFIKDFCAERDLRVEWTQTVECDGFVAVSFVLRGDYMIPTVLVNLGYLWRTELENLLRL